MGETLAETRVEVESLRGELQGQADELKARIRRAFDVRARLRENPLLFIGLGAGALFLLAGGPTRVTRTVRRRVRPTAAEQAYDALPKSLQAWVDTIAGGTGPRARQVRQGLAEELLAWRHNATKSRRARRQLAKALAEGRPGPERAIWSAVEGGLAILTAALARRAVDRWLSGPPTAAAPAAEASEQEAAEPSAGGSAGGPPGQGQYSGFSTLARGNG